MDDEKRMVYDRQLAMERALGATFEDVIGWRVRDVSKHVEEVEAEIRRRREELRRTGEEIRDVMEDVQMEVDHAEMEVEGDGFSVDAEVEDGEESSEEDLSEDGEKFDELKTGTKQGIAAEKLASAKEEFSNARPTSSRRWPIDLVD